MVFLLLYYVPSTVCRFLHTASLSFVVYICPFPHNVDNVDTPTPASLIIGSGNMFVKTIVSQPLMFCPCPLLYLHSANYTPCKVNVRSSYNHFSLSPTRHVTDPRFLDPFVLSRGRHNGILRISLVVDIGSAHRLANITLLTLIATL